MFIWQNDENIFIGSYEFKILYLRRTRNICMWFLINVNSLKSMLKGNELYHRKVQCSDNTIYIIL